MAPCSGRNVQFAGDNVAAAFGDIAIETLAHVVIVLLATRALNGTRARRGVMSGNCVDERYGGVDTAGGVRSGVDPKHRRGDTLSVNAIFGSAFTDGSGGAILTVRLGAHVVSLVVGTTLLTLVVLPSPLVHAGHLGLIGGILVLALVLLVLAFSIIVAQHLRA